MRPTIKKFVTFCLTSALTLTLLGAIGGIGLYAYITPRLPEINSLKNVQLQVPLRVYARGGELMAEFGEMKRTPLKYEEFPKTLIHAVLSAEDDRFYEHPGVDYQGILRATWKLVSTGERTQGGSTITMQVARNFFLSREKTFLRKINEIFLALKIEGELTKDEILTLYLNKIYLGKRAYGFAAAAQVYYGKPLAKLNLSEFAMIAGLPKAPSRYNPVVNPERARIRRDYVLGRMLALGYIDKAEYDQSKQVQVHASVHGLNIGVEAPYVAEMVRNEMVRRYGDAAYTGGFEVYTTIDAHLQKAANRSLRDDLLAYERRHGYSGIIKHVDLLGLEGDDLTAWAGVLQPIKPVGHLQPALIISVGDQSAYAFSRDGQLVYLGWDQIKWARRRIDENHLGPKLQHASEVLKAGDVVYVAAAGTGCHWLAQIPKVAGALVSLRPKDGATETLVGGFDYYQSKFNRVIQAQRQPGSSFKPFVYAAALDKGYTAASIINDAPVVFDAPGLEDTWRPENYSGRFFGPTRLRVALIKSRNLVSIRLLRDIGIGYAVRYVTRFGFKPKNLPHDLSLALGSGAVAPYKLATAYAVFANGGYKIAPYFIDYIREGDTIVDMTRPLRVCPKCEAALDARLKAKVDDKTAPKSAPKTTEGAVETKESPEESIPWVLPAQYTGLTEREWAQIRQGPQLPRLAKRVLSPQTAFLINSMLRDVIRKGTGRRALVLKRTDLGGKTGTTNDQRDAWFTGFNGDVVTIAWVGFDTPQPLGSHETGARAALPMWISYMRAALQGRPETPLEQPPGIVSVRIDPDTGELADANQADAIFEYFRSENVPKRQTEESPANSPAQRGSNITEQLF